MQGTIHLPRPRVLLLADMSYALHRAAAIHKDLQYEGTYTGGLFGLMGTLAKQIREINATHVVMCTDQPPYERSREYPQYKMVRKKAADPELKERVRLSKPLAEEFCRTVGIPIVGVQGFEADDCSGMIVKMHRARFDEIYLGAKDSDLYQLLVHSNVRVMKGSEREDIVTRESLAVGKLGMTPDEYVLSQCLQGTHNDVEGIDGVGPVSAYKAVKQPGYMAALRAKHADLIDRNLALSKLPHTKMPYLPLPERGHFDARALYRFAGALGIEVTISVLDALKQISK